MNRYGRLDKLLHQLALGPRFMRRVAFDMDSVIAPRPEPAKAPTYVVGLARSGTTILLEALYATNEFVTLTYRNMPFVMAPTLWGKLSASHQRQGALAERAHGDRLKVGFDSPEAFEEVFWLTVTGGEFIQKSGLKPHTVDDEDIEDYRRYVHNVVAAATGPGRRYLAKNNNNLLRLRSLRRAFPDARIVVPFRNPYDQAKSLLQQHRRFCETHESDPFARSYMRWLGHFEFGLNMKPFLVGGEERTLNPSGFDTIDGWIEYWAYVYEYVLNEHAGDVLLFDYDAFCADPDRSFERLAEYVDVDSDSLMRFGASVKHANTYPEAAASRNERPNKVHEELIAHSRC